MAEERTLALVKPDATEHTREIFGLINEAGFVLVAEKVIRLTFEAATIFYQEHVGKSFFSVLCEHMSSGPVTAMVLTHPDGGAIRRWRNLIGATDPNAADMGTIRARFGTGHEIHRNVVHGSANPNDAEREIALLFTGLDLA